MNRRPKFWMHRTKRFWWGLAILLLLQGVWITASYRGVRASFDSSSMWDHGTLAVMHGGLEFILYRTDSPPPLSSYDWTTEQTEINGMRLEPECSWRSADWGMAGTDVLELTIFLPGWIPVLIWLIWWPLRMRRADKVEEGIARQGGSGMPEAVDQGPP